MVEKAFKLVLKKAATEGYDPYKLQEEAQQEIILTLMRSGYDRDDAVLVLEVAMGLWIPSDDIDDDEAYFDDDDEEGGGGGEVH